MRPAALAAHTRAELVLTLRRGESLLLTLGIPVLLLVFFGSVDVLPVEGEPIDFLAPGILALAVMSTSMVGLGIGTGFERQYGVLKRLGSTPLGRGGLLTAKTATVVAIELVQLVLLVAIAMALGWDTDASGWPAALAAVVLGTVAFAGIGLFFAGTLKGEVNLAVANGLYLVLLLFGDLVFPLDELPDAIATVCRMLPSAALAELLRGSLTPGETASASAWLVLVAWAAAANVATARTFRWT